MTQILALTRAASASWTGKRRAFFLRSMAIQFLRGQPLDVETFGARMRLYPYNNVCEKRILFTPQYFDPAERELLQSRMRPDFVFLDIGANIGGYSLFVAACAGQRARILAIEPQPEIFERLIYNIRQNPFATIKAIDCAVADLDTEVTLFIDLDNRGETSMRIMNFDVEGTEIRVPAKALASIVAEEGFARIDAMKLDVEGAEDLILEPFFREAAGDALAAASAHRIHPAALDGRSAGAAVRTGLSADPANAAQSGLRADAKRARPDVEAEPLLGRHIGLGCCLMSQPFDRAPSYGIGKACFRHANQGRIWPDFTAASRPR